MNRANSCIRVHANENQINSCKEELEKVQEPISRLSKILNLSGNEVRLKILFLLHTEGEMCPCDLSDVLGISVSAVSQHLTKMNAVRLLLHKKIGQTIFYSIINENTEILIPVLEKISILNTVEIEN